VITVIYKVTRTRAKPAKIIVRRVTNSLSQLSASIWGIAAANGVIRDCTSVREFGSISHL
jgi:hypothetical protein